MATKASQRLGESIWQRMGKVVSTIATTVQHYSASLIYFLSILYLLIMVYGFQTECGVVHSNLRLARYAGVLQFIMHLVKNCFVLWAISLTIFDFLHKLFDTLNARDTVTYARNSWWRTLRTWTRSTNSSRRSDTTSVHTTTTAINKTPEHYTITIYGRQH